MIWTTHLPLIATLCGIRPDEALAYTQALVDVGFDVIEIPLNLPDRTQSVQSTARALGDHALIGAGTVLRPEDVGLMVAAGGKLVVTPNTHTPVVRVAAQAGLVTCIGCMTVTEAFAALDAGAQALKIFPAGAFDPGYVRALKAVLPAEVPVFAVGGITPEDLVDYLAAGCIGTGLDSDPYHPGQPVKRTAERTRAFVTAYHSAQSDRT